MAVGGSPRLHRVGATVDEQLSHARWQALSTDFGGEFVCGLCARIGGDDLPEGLGGAADRGGIDVLVNNAALSEELGPKKRACRLGRRRTRSTHARES